MGRWQPFIRNFMVSGLLWGAGQAQAEVRRHLEHAQVEVDENGLAILNVTLHALDAKGSTRAFRFLLDTGSVLCVLDTSVPEGTFWEDGATRQVTDATGAGMTLPLVAVKRMQAGGMIRDGVAAVRVDLKHELLGRFQDRPVDGILGMSFLDGTRFVLEMQRQRVAWWGQAAPAGAQAWRKVPVSFQEGQETGEIGMDIWAAGPVCFDFVAGHLTLATDPVLSLAQPRQPSLRLPLVWVVLRQGQRVEILFTSRLGQVHGPGEPRQK